MIQKLTNPSIIENELCPFVSVVIATFRRDITLQNAIQSLLLQTYKNIEIVIVDDNADLMWNQKASKIVEEYNENGNIVYLQNASNMGSAQTRNIGINSAKGDYICFLDDDDIYLLNKIENQVKHMLDMNSDYSITDLDLYNEDDKYIEKRKRNYIKNKDKKSLMKYHLMYHMTGTDTMMFKKEYLLKIGGFPPINVGDEFYLMKEAIIADGIFSYLPVCDVKAYIHTETDGLSSGESKIKGENSLYEYKKAFFDNLDSKTVRYIKMRHYAVLAFAGLRKKDYFYMIKNSVVSFVFSPTKFIELFTTRK